MLDRRLRREEKMEEHYRYNEIKPIYDSILNDYLVNLEGYNYSTTILNDNEKVFLVEDSFIIYIGLKPNKGMHDWICRSQGLRVEEPDLTQLYSIVFEELSYNEIFKFKSAEFIRKHNHYFYDFLIYKSFNGVIDFVDPYGKEYRNSVFLYVNNFCPSLELLNRYEKWPGFLVNFIIYELQVNENIGHGICYTTDILTTKYAYKKVEDLEYCGAEENYRFCKIGKHSETMGGHNGVHANVQMLNNLFVLIQNNKETEWKNVKRNIFKTSYLAEVLKFFVVPVYIKDKNKVWETEKNILLRVENGDFSEIERLTYDINDYKWKSEELCLRCVKEIFGDNKVIHQYKPYFLRTDKGQLSYDIYITSKKIAIEYQGKQHFEPIELFGGIDNFKLQQKRDELKKELSKKHGIKLVFVNYWENISVELIKSKILEISV